jgi:hypothetical protein
MGARRVFAVNGIDVRPRELCEHPAIFRLPII